MSRPTILDALSDPELFGNSFAGDSWDTWRAVLAGAFALDMTDQQVEAFKRLSGGREVPAKPVRELYAIAGRRSAKSNVSAAIAAYLGTVAFEQDGTLSRLAAGEVPVIALIAVDRYQARVLSGYVNGILESSPILSGMIAKAGVEAVELTNGVRIEIFTNNFRAVRGRTLLAVVLDECAFYRSESTANPDIETYRAVMPSLATTGGLLIGVSSPYAKRGLLWSKYRKHFGRNDDVLVVQGKTKDFNPTLDQRIIDDAQADDPEAAKSEWLGQFRSDIESFLDREIIDKLVRPEPLELPFDRRWRYQAFVDPSGGGADEFSICIGHKPTDTKIHGVNIGGASDKVIIDVLRARRGPPGAIVREYAQLLKSYGIKDVSGDKYAGSWPAQEFERHGIRYHHARKSKSDLYTNALAQFNNGRVELPPDDRLVIQLAGLERKTSRAGRDSIDHAPGGHDDRANAVAGLISTTASRSQVSTKVAAVGGCY